MFVRTHTYACFEKSVHHYTLFLDVRVSDTLRDTLRPGVLQASREHSRRRAAASFPHTTSFGLEERYRCGRSYYHGGEAHVDVSVVFQLSTTIN